MNLFEENIYQSAKITKEALLHENFKNGNIKIAFISNRNKDTDKVILTKLKCLFQKQLSKMPREYILRQIFDDKHLNLVLLNNYNNVIGGICFRPFHERKFYEIVFCAVDSSYQIKGIGSLMMDILKECVKLDFCEYIKFRTKYKFENKYIDSLSYFNSEFEGVSGNLYFVTYADNFAVGYFKKQGFRSTLTFDEWIGYIKDYEGGTIMECNIFWEINYIQKYKIINDKKQEFIDRLKNTTPFYKTYKLGADVAITDIRSLPGISSDMVMNKDRRNRENCLHGFIKLMISILQEDPNSWPFHEPVSAKDVPDYYEIIKSPMDLSKIQEKHMKGVYKNLDLFIADVHLMLNNCLKFNGRDTQYHKCANALFDLFDERLKYYNKSIKRWKLIE